MYIFSVSLYAVSVFLKCVNSLMIPLFSEVLSANIPFVKSIILEAIISSDETAEPMLIGLVYFK